MPTLSPSRVRGKSEEWPSRSQDNRKKLSVHATTVSGNNWPRDTHPNSSRYKSNIYQQDCAAERDNKFPEEKTSEETFVEEEEGANKNILHNYSDDMIYVNEVPKHNNTILREKFHRYNDHSEFSMPEAMIAMQKLQRLKELQMKRDISERYYSQEIKRLIGEYYLGTRMATPLARPTAKLQSSSFQHYSENRFKNVPENLEPCGTMTTITRLTCGCIQETTRPIFTTPRGRVQKKNCNQSQHEMLLKLTASNPQEHLFSSLEEPHIDRYRAKPKKRMPMDPRLYTNIPSAGDQEFDTERKKRNEPQEPETIGRVSRTPSPHRKFSDTSATSI